MKTINANIEQIIINIEEYISNIAVPFQIFDLPLNIVGFSSVFDISNYLEYHPKLASIENYFFSPKIIANQYSIQARLLPFEIEKQFFVPGHRLLPLHDLDINPEEISFISNKGEKLPMKTISIELECIRRCFLLYGQTFNDFVDISMEDSNLCTVKVLDLSSLNQEFNSKVNLLFKCKDYDKHIFELVSVSDNTYPWSENDLKLFTTVSNDLIKNPPKGPVNSPRQILQIASKLYGKTNAEIIGPFGPMLYQLCKIGPVKNDKTTFLSNEDTIKQLQSVLYTHQNEFPYLYIHEIEERYCYYYGDDHSCQLKKQFRKRNLSGKQWNPILSEMDIKNNKLCSFYQNDQDTLKTTSCPEFKIHKILDDNTILRKKLPLTYSGINNYMLIGETLPDDHLFLQQTKLGRGDSTIFFCTHEAFIHPSYCSVCKYYSGDFTTSNYSNEKKHPDGCRRSHMSVAKIINNTLYFTEQYLFDRDIGGTTLLYSYIDKNIFLLPISTDKIRHANQPVVYKYNFLRWSDGYCVRCGMEESGSIHFACFDGCGTRKLCENCIAGAKWEIKDDDSCFVTFICPDCGGKTEINLGRNGSDAAIYEKGNRTAYLDNLNKKSNPFIQVDYHNLLDSIQSSAKNTERLRISNIKDDLKIKNLTINEDIDTSLFYQEAPHLMESKIAFIQEGLMRGLYYYSLIDKKAYIYKTNPGVRRKLTKWSIDGDFTYDIIISYGTQDYEFVEELKAELEKKGLAVFYINVMENNGDNLWNIRFREALFYSRYFLPISSADYLERSGSAFEFYEAQKISKEHQIHEDICLFPIIPILVGIGNISDLKQKEYKWLRNDQPSFMPREKIGVPRQPQLNQESFNWNYIPFMLEYDKIGIKRIADFIHILNLSSKKKSFDFQFLNEIGNQFLGIIPRKESWNCTLVFQALYDKNKIHLLKKKDVYSNLKFTETINKDDINIHSIELSKVIEMLTQL